MLSRCVAEISSARARALMKCDASAGGSLASTRSSSLRPLKYGPRNNRYVPLGLSLILT